MKYVRTRFFNVLTPPPVSAEDRKHIEDAVKEDRFRDLDLVPHAISADGGLAWRGHVGTVMIEVTEIFQPGEHGSDFEVYGN